MQMRDQFKRNFDRKFQITMSGRQGAVVLAALSVLSEGTYQAAAEARARGDAEFADELETPAHEQVALRARIECKVLSPRTKKGKKKKGGS